MHVVYKAKVRGIFLDNQGCPERECSALLWGGLGIGR